MPDKECFVEEPEDFRGHMYRDNFDRASNVNNARCVYQLMTVLYTLWDTEQCQRFDYLQADRYPGQNQGTLH